MAAMGNRWLAISNRFVIANFPALLSLLLLLLLLLSILLLSNVCLFWLCVDWRWLRRCRQDLSWRLFVGMYVCMLICTSICMHICLCVQVYLCMLLSLLLHCFRSLTVYCQFSGAFPPGYYCCLGCCCPLLSLVGCRAAANGSKYLRNKFLLFACLMHLIDLHLPSLPSGIVLLSLAFEIPILLMFL